MPKTGQISYDPGRGSMILRLFDGLVIRWGPELKRQQTVEFKDDQFTYRVQDKDGRTVLSAQGKVKVERLGPFKVMRLSEIRGGYSEGQLEPTDDDRQVRARLQAALAEATYESNEVDSAQAILRDGIAAMDGESPSRGRADLHPAWAGPSGGRAIRQRPCPSSSERQRMRARRGRTRPCAGTARSRFVDRPNRPRRRRDRATTGHMLAFIQTLDHPVIVGVNPEVAHEHMAGLNFTHGLAQAIDAGKLFHIDLNDQGFDRYDQDIRLGAMNLKNAFFLVKLPEDNGYAGSRPFDAHAYRTEDFEGVKDFARGCMRTYLILKDKATQWNGDKEIQSIVAEMSGDDGSMNGYFGKYSADKAGAIKAQSFDRSAIAGIVANDCFNVMSNFSSCSDLIWEVFSLSRQGGDSSG